MRLWSLHPKYLDVKGLTAVWREALLAQSVLSGQRTAYQYHPQLNRFRAQLNPQVVIATYLRGIADEADRRGYHFNRNLIGPGVMIGKIPVTRGQLLYEWWWLKSKLAKRDPQRLEGLRDVIEPEAHPLFSVIPGDVADWERRHDQETNPEDKDRIELSGGGA